MRDYDLECTTCRYVIVAKFDGDRTVMTTIEESKGKATLYHQAVIKPGLFNLKGFSILEIPKQNLTDLIGAYFYVKNVFHVYLGSNS